MKKSENRDVKKQKNGVKKGCKLVSLYGGFMKL